MAKVNYKLAVDTGDLPVQVLGLGEVTQINLADDSPLNLTEVSQESILRVAVNADVWIAQGPGAVASPNSSFMPAGVEFLKLRSGDRLSVMRVSGEVVGSVTAMI